MLESIIFKAHLCNFDFDNPTLKIRNMLFLSIYVKKIVSY
jgi:hypothetical protein